ncbi:TIGR00180 family glycosyltransferase [Saprospiraceae bacterium]|nr:TIGR00180 family glycosyltransferase [Saprospiraceae bacterium]
MSSLSDVTIVIPSFNRPKYLRRANFFWSKYDVRVIILDGSLDEMINVKWGNNVEYIHKPISFFKRLRFASTLVDTKYVSLLSDDEFYLPSSIESVLNELDKDSDLVSCGGQCVLFDYSNGKVNGRPFYPKLKNYNVSSVNPLDRMNYHMSNYVPSTLYSIMKVDVWNRAIDIMTEQIFDVYALTELQFEIATSFYGKTKNINQLFWLRSNENVPVRNEKGLDPNKSFYKWWKSEESDIFLQRQEFIELMTGKLAQEFNDSTENLKEGILKAFDFYHNQCRKSIYFRMIQKITRYHNSVRPTRLDKTISEFDEKGLEVDKSDIENIKKAIKKFAKVS